MDGHRGVHLLIMEIHVSRKACQTGRDSEAFLITGVQAVEGLGESSELSLSLIPESYHGHVLVVEVI